MQNETKERWLEICERVAIEQDPDKFLQLVRELNDLLEEKQNRIRALRKPTEKQRPFASP